MKCLFINLESDLQRRAAVEQSFQRFLSPGWDLERVEAIAAKDISTSSANQKISSNEQACYFSHLKALEISKQTDGPVMICEDDVRFGPSTAKLVGDIVNTMTEDWDLFFPEVGIAAPVFMVQLFQLKQRLAIERKVQVLDLAKYSFFGSTCYIVNANSKTKCQEALKAEFPQAPYDMVLRKLIHTGQFRAKCALPFLTSISEHAMNSQIQPQDGEMADFIWNEFRKLIFIDYNSEMLDKNLDEVAGGISNREIDHFANIIKISLSPKFKSK